MKRSCNIFWLAALFFLTSCAVGPDYVRPPTPASLKYKELPAKGWKRAAPCDMCDRGQWWKIFRDPQLDMLEAQLNITNQNIVQAAAQYRQAKALEDEASASFFPTLAGTFSVMRQKQGSSSSATASTTSASSSSVPSAGSSTTITAGKTGSVFNSNSWLLDANWEPDIWGSVRRTVEAAADNAQSLAAAISAARLSAQGSLAQLYFQVRNLDSDQRLLDDTVRDYQKALTLTRNRYRAGVAARTDVVQAESQLEQAQALALNNHILRAQSEHAIAVLMGMPPIDYSQRKESLRTFTPRIPVEVPSILLERRPDVAAAERLVAQANAQIGIAISAYYPTITLTSTGSQSSHGFAHWFSIPGVSWSLGAQLAETFLDGGLRGATVKAARENYLATVAAYRLTVLTAFQNVEDSLVALRVLRKQTVVQDKAAASARFALELVMNQYKSGTVAYSDVITAQTTAYTAQKAAVDTHGLQKVAAVGLIKALGGGWDSKEIFQPQ